MRNPDLDPTSDPDLFFSGFQDAKNRSCFAYSLLYVDLHQSSKKTRHYEFTKQLKSRHLKKTFCLLMEGSGSEAGSISRSEEIITDRDPGGPKNFGSGTMVT